MKYSILISPKAKKSLRRLPADIVERFYLLTRVLEQKGPTGPYMMRNYSKLSATEYHCHLTYSYVVCWRHEGRNLVVEVYYVGSRESAPY